MYCSIMSVGWNSHVAISNVPRILRSDPIAPTCPHNARRHQSIFLAPETSQQTEASLERGLGSRESRCSLRCRRMQECRPGFPPCWASTRSISVVKRSMHRPNGLLPVASRTSRQRSFEWLDGNGRHLLGSSARELGCKFRTLLVVMDH